MRGGLLLAPLSQGMNSLRIEFVRNSSPGISERTERGAPTPSLTGHGNTFGTQKKKKCRMHGAATTGFLYFAVFLLTTHGHHLGRMQGVYRQGLDTLVAIQDAIKAFPGKFPDVAKIKFAQHVSDHLEAVVALGMGNKPKHHMLIELASRLHVAMCINFH